MADSGYGGAAVRDVLDMRTGVTFRETYTAADSAVRGMERSVGSALSRHRQPWQTPDEALETRAQLWQRHFGWVTECGFTDRLDLLDRRGIDIAVV